MYYLHKNIKNLLQKHTNPLVIVPPQIILDYILKIICKTTKVSLIFIQAYISFSIGI